MIIESPARVSFPDSPVFSHFSLEIELFRLIGLARGDFHLLSLMALGWLFGTRVPGHYQHLNSYADSIGLVMPSE